MKKIKRRGWKNSPKPLHFTSPHNSYLARARKEKKKLPTLSSQNPLPEGQRRRGVSCSLLYRWNPR